jgi:hypothetical protein
MPIARIELKSPSGFSTSSIRDYRIAMSSSKVHKRLSSISGQIKRPDTAAPILDHPCFVQIYADSVQGSQFCGSCRLHPGLPQWEGELDRISETEEQMKAAKGAIWGEGILDYLNVLEGWRAQGNLRGLEITVRG